ncbi:hypothetical protein ANN_03127 [Periplaneta americana]|uniref:Uncharacterized protein n=1 Tax=Periplaneta americana TaxID=6978 RepID=A0ABQ8TZV0_PERAM|nr:hypothetical protein ANN_03127 [Periplaneta americana]
MMWNFRVLFICSSEDVSCVWQQMGAIFSNDCEHACDVTCHTGYGASSSRPPSELPSGIVTVKFVSGDSCFACGERADCSSTGSHRPFRETVASSHVYATALKIRVMINLKWGFCRKLFDENLIFM